MNEDETIITMIGNGYQRGDWVEIDGVLYEVVGFSGRYRMKLKPLPWWLRNLRTLIALAAAFALVAFVVANVAYAQDEHGSVLLGADRHPGTLADCDSEWKLRGIKRPRYAIVVNQTICEPKLPCHVRGGQAYVRTCRIGIHSQIKRTIGKP